MGRDTSEIHQNTGDKILQIFKEETNIGLIIRVSKLLL